MAVKLPWTVESGALLPTLANCAESVGDPETRKERWQDMLANETTPKSSQSTKPRMKDGEEPTEVLLALVSSPLLALQARGVAKVLTAKGSQGQTVVLAVFDKSEWDSTVGITLAKELPTEPTKENTGS